MLIFRVITKISKTFDFFGQKKKNCHVFLGAFIWNHPFSREEDLSHTIKNFNILVQFVSVCGGGAVLLMQSRLLPTEDSFDRNKIVWKRTGWEREVS